MTDIKIFIDTNVLYHYLELNIKLVDEIEKIINKSYVILIHPMVESEIISDLTKPGKIARYAQFAIEFISNFESYQDNIEYDGADKALLLSAKREGGILLTFDKELKERCKNLGIPVLTNSKKGRLQLIGYIT